MKKLKVLSMAAVAAGLVLLTSCLGKGSNSYENTAVGVVEMSMKSMRKLVYPSGDVPLYLSSVTNDPSITEGTCVIVHYSVDQDAADNANASANGFFTATGSVLGTVSKSYMDYGTPDTGVVHTKELMFKDAGIAGYVETESNKYIFTQAAPTSLLKEQKDEYYLTCDFNQTPQTVDGTERVYTLFLRGVKVKDGQAPTIENGVDYHAFNATQFYSRLKSQEQAASKETIKFVIKFPTEFNSDSTSIKTWKSTNIISIAIPKETNQ